MRILTIGLAVILIVSCAAILITPDPTDDVDGVIGQHHQLTLPNLEATVSAQLDLFVPPTPRSLFDITVDPHTCFANLLDLVCVRLC